MALYNTSDIRRQARSCSFPIKLTPTSPDRRSPCLHSSRQPVCHRNMIKHSNGMRRLSRCAYDGSLAEQCTALHHTSMLIPSSTHDILEADDHDHTYNPTCKLISIDYIYLPGTAFVPSTELQAWGTHVLCTAKKLLYSAS
jgi:hypothetical protein